MILNEITSINENIYKESLFYISGYLYVKSRNNLNIFDDKLKLIKQLSAVELLDGISDIVKKQISFTHFTLEGVSSPQLRIILYSEKLGILMVLDKLGKVLFKINYSAQITISCSKDLISVYTKNTTTYDDSKSKFKSEINISESGVLKLYESSKLKLLKTVKVNCDYYELIRVKNKMVIITVVNNTIHIVNYLNKQKIIIPSKAIPCSKSRLYNDKLNIFLNNGAIIDLDLNNLHDYEIKKLSFSVLNHIYIDSKVHHYFLGDDYYIHNVDSDFKEKSIFEVPSRLIKNIFELKNRIIIFEKNKILFFSKKSSYVLNSNPLISTIMINLNSNLDDFMCEPGSYKNRLLKSISLKNDLVDVEQIADNKFVLAYADGTISMLELKLK